MKTITKLLLILLLAGCSTSTNHTKTKINELKGWKWTLVSLDGEKISLPEGSQEAYITFKNNENMEVGGSNSCNAFFGSFSIKNDSISFSEINKTLRACQMPFAEIETRFMEMLDRVTTFEIKKDQLILSTGDANLATFKKEDLPDD